MKQIALQLYRLAVVAVIAWLLRDLAVRQRTHGDSPIAVDEMKKLLPDAYSLRPDSTERDGLFVLDRQGRELGYVVRTQPYCRDILGYCGVTDALVVLGPDWKILGITVHASDDTKEHVYDVVTALREADSDASVEVFVREDDHPQAAATTRSARSASMAYATAASIPSLVRRGCPSSSSWTVCP